MQVQTLRYRLPCWMNSSSSLLNWHLERSTDAGTTTVQQETAMLRMKPRV